MIRANRQSRAAIVAMLLLGTGPLAQTSDAAAPLWGTNGRVNALVESGGILYLGGNFSELSVPTGALVQLDLVYGSPSPSFPNVVGSVNCIAPDGAGGWYIGGSFTHIGGVPRQSLAHLDSGHSVTAWDPQPDGTVQSIVPQGSTVYVRGTFNNIGGAARARLAALDATTGQATAWNPAPDDRVSALAVDGGTVYVGGYFRNIGGQPRNYLAALDTVTGTATAWNPDPSLWVYAIVPMGPEVYVGGRFNSVGGQPRALLAALDKVTGLATAWDPAPDSYVEQLWPNGSTLYVSGIFNNIGSPSVPRLRTAEIDRTTGAATAWDPGVRVQALARLGSVVFLGGSFSQVGPVTRNGMAAVDDVVGFPVLSWDPKATQWSFYTPSCSAIATDGSIVVAGGSFLNAGVAPVARNNLAAIDLATGQPTSWDPDPDGVVHDLELTGNGTLYAGGTFLNVGGAQRDLLAEIDLATGTATAWAPQFTYGFQLKAVQAVARQGNTVYAGGEFAMSGGSTVWYNLAAFDAATGTRASWSPPAMTPARVRALAVDGSRLYVGGDFTTAGAATRNHLAALDLPGGTLTTWDPDASGLSYPAPTVKALVVDGSSVFAGGSFTSIGGTARNGLAAISALTGLATSWDPMASAFSVEALALDGPVLYVGGSFGNMGGRARSNAAALHSGTGAAGAWDPAPASTISSVGAEVHAFAVSGPSVHVGGTFMAAEGEPVAGVFVSSAVPTHAPVVVEQGGDALRLACSPNPFDAATTLRFTLPEAARVRVEIFDVTGRRVDVPVRNVWMEKGAHAVGYRGVGLPAGVYFSRVRAGERVATDRLLIVR